MMTTMLAVPAAAQGSLLATPEFWVAVAFFAFLALLAYKGVPGMVAKALDQRADAIRKELDEARRLREEAQALLADYQRKTREAETEARAIVDQARREAEAVAEETRRNLKESLERRTRIAEEKIARAETQALGEVRSAAVDSAMAAAERVLRSRLQGADGAALLEEGIRELKGKIH
jgi:F-type H+-transporting ATPase subunit b